MTLDNNFQYAVTDFMSNQEYRSFNPPMWSEHVSVIIVGLIRIHVYAHRIVCTHLTTPRVPLHQS
jgi:hypothetical protein